MPLSFSDDLAKSYAMTEIPYKKHLTRFISHPAQVIKEKHEKQREEDSNYVVVFSLHLLMGG